MATVNGEAGVSTRKKVTNDYEVEFKRAKEIIQPMLYERLKKHSLILSEFEELVNIVCGVVAQHYREGAYHGDIDAKGH